MHRVTRQAAHRAALVTRRLEQAVVFATGDADHAVGPVAIADKRGLASQQIPVPGFSGVRRGAQDRNLRLEILARTIAKALEAPRMTRRNRLDAVTLTADLRGGLGME